MAFHRIYKHAPLAQRMGVKRPGRVRLGGRGSRAPIGCRLIPLTPSYFERVSNDDGGRAMIGRVLHWGRHRQALIGSHGDQVVASLATIAKPLIESSHNGIRLNIHHRRNESRSRLRLLGPNDTHKKNDDFVILVKSFFLLFLRSRRWSRSLVSTRITRKVSAHSTATLSRRSTKKDKKGKVDIEKFSFSDASSATSTSPGEEGRK